MARPVSRPRAKLNEEVKDDARVRPPPNAKYRIRTDRGSIYVGQTKKGAKIKDKALLMQQGKKTKTGPGVNLNRDARIEAGTKVGNGKALFLEHVDGRRIRARRFREVYRALIRDLGGDLEVTHGQRHMCRRAAGLTVMAEELEAHWALADGQFSLLEYITLAKTERAVLSLLGIERKIKTIDQAPDLSEYIDTEYSEEENDPDNEDDDDSPLSPPSRDETDDEE